MISEITQGSLEEGERKMGLVTILLLDKPINTNLHSTCFHVEIQTRFSPTTSEDATGSSYKTDAIGRFYDNGFTPIREFKTYIRHTIKTKDKRKAIKNHFDILRKLEESYFTGEKFRIR